MSQRTEFSRRPVSVIDYVNQNLRFVTICDWISSLLSPIKKSVPWNSSVTGEQLKGFAE